MYDTVFYACARDARRCLGKTTVIPLEELRSIILPMLTHSYEPFHHAVVTALWMHQRFFHLPSTCYLVSLDPPRMMHTPMGELSHAMVLDRSFWKFFQYWAELYEWNCSMVSGTNRILEILHFSLLASPSMPSSAVQELLKFFVVTPTAPCGLQLTMLLTFYRRFCSYATCTPTEMLRFTANFCPHLRMRAMEIPYFDYEFDMTDPPSSPISFPADGELIEEDDCDEGEGSSH